MLYNDYFVGGKEQPDITQYLIHFIQIPKYGCL